MKFCLTEQHQVIIQNLTGSLLLVSVSTTLIAASVLALWSKAWLRDGGSDLFDSDGYEYGNWFGVRPVVYLNANVTVNDLTISKTGKEAQWPYTLPESYSGHSINAGRIEENGGGAS